MNDIQYHNFDVQKNAIKEFSEKLPEPVKIQSVNNVDKGIIYDSDHKVTGWEFNERLSQINRVTIDVNNEIANIVKEFRVIYEAFDALDKDYINGILCSVKSAENASNEAKELSEKLQEVVDALERSVSSILYKIQEQEEKISSCSRKLQECDNRLTKFIETSNENNDSMVKTFEKSIEMFSKKILESTKSNYNNDISDNNNCDWNITNGMRKDIKMLKCSLMIIAVVFLVLTVYFNWEAIVVLLK